MLPVPIDAARAVMNAWNGVSAPSAPGRLPDERDAARIGKSPHLHERGDGG